MTQIPVYISEHVRECDRDSREWFPAVYKHGDLGALTHHILSTCGEAGELANKLKKVLRKELPLDQEARDILADEAIDVQIYLWNVFAILGVDIADEYRRKRLINAARFGKETA